MSKRSLSSAFNSFSAYFIFYSLILIVTSVVLRDSEPWPQSGLPTPLRVKA
jgi:hypothetical protein